MADCYFRDNGPRKGVFLYISEGKTRRRLKKILLKFGGRDSEELGWSDLYRLALVRFSSY